MKVRTGFLVSSAASALLLSVGAMGASAADVLPVKAPPAVIDSTWAWEGYAEMGGRFFLQKEGGVTGQNWKNLGGFSDSLGKFYEYRDLRPGPAGNLALHGLTRDGLYSIDIEALNIGYRDQFYSFNWTKAGEQYFDFSWDQTPHIYNENAGTIYNGVGSNNLTIPNSVRTGLAGTLNAAVPPVPASPAAAATAANIIQGNLNDFLLGFQRDTADVNYRWTPNSDWDIRADYTRIRRDGTQPQGALTYQFGTTNPNSTQERSGRVILEVPKPVADTTHNADLSAEYNGVGFWGNKYNIALGYGYSAFQNDNDAFTFQNPWVTDAAGNTPGAPLTNQMSLAPDNSANIIRATGGADLPWNSRYSGAMNYNMTRQNDGFLPYTSNTSLNAGNVCVTQAATPPGCSPLGFFPFLSNAGELGNNALLLNNVLTTKWSSDVKTTLRYRYYDFAATQNPITTNSWIYADAINASEDTLTSFGISYKKQDASGDVAWTPDQWITIGGGVGWERWDRDHRDVNVTDEWMGKVFTDFKPFDWSMLRMSYLHGSRRFDSYSTDVESNFSNGYFGYRLFDMANRDRDQAKVLWDIYLPYSVTVTPNGSLRYDHYGTDPFAALEEMGLLQDNAWDAGIEVSWVPVRGSRIFASYTHEEGVRHINAANSTTTGLDVWTRDNNDTLVIGANTSIIPDRLDLKGTFTVMRYFGSLAQGQGPGNTSLVSSTAFPDVHTNFNRVDIVASYRFDKVQYAGLPMQPFVKLRYLWERNSTDDWQPLSWNYMYNFALQTSSTFAKGIMLGWDNPNYNVQAMMISAGVKW